MKTMDGLAAFGCALLFSVSVSGQTNVPPAKGQEQRFLFLVDVSASMKKIEAGTRQAVFDLIYLGIDGQMKKGDTFGIWTFNEKLNAGQVPMQTWEPDKVLPKASLAAKYVQSQQFEGKSLAHAALSRAGSIIRIVRDLNVVLITDGQTPISGTGFDDKINSACQQRARDREKAKKPLIITFIARGGVVTNTTVTLAGEPIFIPPPSPQPPKEIVLQPKIPATNLAAAPGRRITTIRKTNSTPLIIRPNVPAQLTSRPPVDASSNAQPAIAEAPTPLLHPADFIGSNEALGFTSRAPANVLKTVDSNVVRVALQTAAPSQTVPDASAAAVAPVATPSPAVSPTNVTRVVRTTNFASAIFPDVPVAARESQPSIHPGPAPRSGLSPSTLITAGVLLLAASMGLLIFGFGRSRGMSRPSLISQSMERQ